jgi:hypothetical protein
MSNVSPMLSDPFVRDLLLLLFSAAVSAIGGFLTIRGTPQGSLAWPTRLYLTMHRTSNVEYFRQYAESRKHFTNREQLFLAAFLWFFIAFLPSALLFGCSYRTGCQ